MHESIDLIHLPSVCGSMYSRFYFYYGFDGELILIETFCVDHPKSIQVKVRRKRSGERHGYHCPD